VTSPLVLPEWLPSFDDMRRRDEQLAQKFYLVRIAGNAGYDSMRCPSGHKHPYLTLACRPQPFSGVDEGIYGVFHALGIPGSEIPKLTAQQRHRFEIVSKLFGPPGAPDLARSHPRTAREMGTAETDADAGAFPLGVLEEVSRRSRSGWSTRSTTRASSRRWWCRACSRTGASASSPRPGRADKECPDELRVPGAGPRAVPGGRRQGLPHRRQGADQP
jgi:hypothetical protein